MIFLLLTVWVWLRPFWHDWPKRYRIRWNNAK